MSKSKLREEGRPFIRLRAKGCKRGSLLEKCCWLAERTLTDFGFFKRKRFFAAAFVDARSGKVCAESPRWSYGVADAARGALVNFAGAKGLAPADELVAMSLEELELRLTAMGKA